MTKKQLEQRMKEIKDCFESMKHEMLSLMDDYGILNEEIAKIDKRLEKLEGDDLK